MAAMSDEKKDSGKSEVQAAVAASEWKPGEMHKCNELRRRFGTGARRRIPVNMLGPHPENRTGVFPNSGRVRQLACEIIALGFSQAEADFEGVCVKEYSAKQLKERPDYKSYAQNVAEKAKGCIKEVYQQSDEDILYGTLSHTHLSVILRAIEQGVKWEIPVDDLTTDQLSVLEPFKEKDTGLLMMSAVAERDPVAKKLVTEGLLMDVLEARIMHEAPGGCAQIAATLNKPQAFAMRMTELEVMKILSQEIIKRSEDGEVTFQAVMEAAGKKMGPWVSDPDFVDFFNFILNLGAEGGPHIATLINFVEGKVNSSKRALRLAAFVTVGQLKTSFPRVKVALIMRAYRLPPRKAMVGAPGWCPEPEAAWKKASLEPQLRLMEDVFHLHYVALRTSIVNLLGGFTDEVQDTPKNAAAVDELLTNVSILCAGQMASVAKMSAPTRPKTQEALLQGCQAAYKTKLAGDDVTKLMGMVKALSDFAWFDFATLPADTKAEAKAAVAAQAAAKPRVITFNAETGAPENEQATVAKEEKKGDWLQLPLTEWLTAPPARTMGKKEAYMGAVVQVLREKHVAICEMADQYEEDDFPMAIFQHTTSRHIKVITKAAVAAGKLEVWPCVPHSCKVHSDSVHPHKVLVQVWDTASEGRAKSSFYLNPEFTIPEGTTAHDVDKSDPLQRVWKWAGKESMHPFWGVTRLTGDELAKRNVAQKDAPRLRFNVDLDRRELKMVKCSRVITISIPVMTNTAELEKGEELVMEVQPIKRKEKVSQDWTTQAKKNIKKDQTKAEHRIDFDSTGHQAI